MVVPSCQVTPSTSAGHTHRTPFAVWSPTLAPFRTLSPRPPASCCCRPPLTHQDHLQILRDPSWTTSSPLGRLGRPIYPGRSVFPGRSSRFPARPVGRPWADRGETDRPHRRDGGPLRRLCPAGAGIGSDWLASGLGAACCSPVSPPLPGGCRVRCPCCCCHLRQRNQKQSRVDPSPGLAAVACPPARPTVVPYPVAILPQVVPTGDEDGAAVVR